MAILVYPKIGEVFELTLTKKQLDEFYMAKNFSRSGHYTYYGRRLDSKLRAGQTAKFKLAQVNFCDNLHEVKEKLKKYGEIPVGL